MKDWSCCKLILYFFWFAFWDSSLICFRMQLQEASVNTNKVEEQMTQLSRDSRKEYQADVLIYATGLGLHWELANGNWYLAWEQESAKKVIVNITHL